MRRCGTAGPSLREIARAVLVIWAVALAALALAATAHAGSTVGSFEIEGNLKDDSGAGEPIDWSSTPPPPNVTTFTDTTGSGDDIFGQGSKELDQRGWKCVTGSAPSKDDLVNGALSFRTIGGKQFVYARWRRAGVNGDAHIDYEFNQSTAPVPSCPALPQRTVGDIVITFDTENGGKTIMVRAFRWTGSTFNPLAVGAQGVTWDGAVNIPSDPTDPALAGIQPGGFGELALNLTDTIGTLACGQFASAFMKTRASTSINAALKDRTGKQPFNPGNCPSSDLDKAVRNETAGEQFTETGPTSTNAKPGDTIEYRLTYTNTGDAPATGVVVTDPVPANSTLLTCSDGCTVSGGTITWNLGTIGPGDTKAVTFRVGLAPSFPAGSTPMTNVGTVDTNEETPKQSNPTTVTVTAAPASDLDKAVRNATGGEQFTATGPTSTTADPGDRIEYRLTYTNTGNASATGVKVTDPVPDHSTFVSCSDGCTVSGGTITWNLGTIAAGATKAVTFVVDLSSSFPAGSTDVTNVATVDTTEEPPKTSNPTTVTVTAAPDLSLLKSASALTVLPGDAITYTLAYANGGDAEATGVRIDEAVPAGTEFVSCTGGCTVSGSTVSWEIGTVPAGGGGSVTLTVRALATVGCSVCNIATVSSPDQGGGAPIPSNQVCLNSTPGPDPAGANASGDATGAHVEVGLLGIDETLPAPASGDPADPSVSSEQHGVGADGQESTFLTVAVPPPAGGVLRADLLRTSSSAVVSEQPVQATDTGFAETLGVNVLDGVVTADLVRAVANATATGDASSFSTAGSTFENLKVLGQTINNVTPGMVVDLPDALFGPNSHVKLLDVEGDTSEPAAGTTSGGTYEAHVRVAMIRVHATTPVTGVVDVVVSEAAAAADFPQTRLCSSAPAQAVSGHAFIASEQTDPSILPLLAGFVGIPTTGGHANQHLNSVVLPDDGSVLTSRAADSDTTGSRTPTESTASSYAQVKALCVLPDAGGCTVGARLVRSQANSRANPAGASSDDAGTEFLGLEVLGTPIGGTPPPNTTIPLPGLGFVVLNEQTCDGGAALPACAGATHTGRTVRAVHVVLTAPLGVDVIVAEAHSDATFAP